MGIGDGFMCLSPKRPGPVLGDVILYPLEKPFQADAAVQSVTIDYPARNSKINGTDWWIFYFFIVFLVSCFTSNLLYALRNFCLFTLCFSNKSYTVLKSFKCIFYLCIELNSFVWYFSVIPIIPNA